MSAGSAVVTLFENADAIKSSYAVKVSIAQMLRGGVVMEVSTIDEARIAEDAGVVAVMVGEEDVSDGGGVQRMADPDLIRCIKKSTSLPVFSRARIGHFVEAQILEEIGVDFVDESEALTCADDVNHINKHNFRVPFVCGCSDLGEVLCRMAEGVSMIRTKGHRDGDSLAKMVLQIRSILGGARDLQGLEKEELFSCARRIRAPYELLKLTKQLGRVPVMVFAYGGVHTPADAAMAMQLGCDGVFVGHHVFKDSDPSRRAKAFVQAVGNYNDSLLLAEMCTQHMKHNENVPPAVTDQLLALNQTVCPEEEQQGSH